MEILKRVWSWVTSFFRPKNESATNAVVPIEKKKRRARVVRDETLKSLLGNLDYAFNEIKVDYHKFSHISKSQVQGLKRYGVSVIPGMEKLEECFDYENTSTCVSQPNNLSSIIFIATNAHRWRDDKSGYVPPDFFYALKLSKPPWYVARNKGVFYECAFGYNMDGKQWWSGFYISIDKNDGEIKPTYHLNHEQVQLPNHSLYCKKVWRISSWNDDNRINVPIVQKTVAFFFNQWQNRTKMWSTTVEKDGIRANFYVDTKDTKYYFKDREKTFTENGSTKRIIHFVDDHERVIDGRRVHVKSHIRGQNKFTWNGYKCRVISPTYHGVEHTNFGIEAVLEEQVPQQKGVQLTELAEILHGLEEKAVIKRKAA